MIEHHDQKGICVLPLIWVIRCLRHCCRMASPGGITVELAKKLAAESSAKRGL